MPVQTLANNVLATKNEGKPRALPADAHAWYAIYLEWYPKYLESGGSVPLSPSELSVVDFFEGQHRSLKNFTRNLKSHYNLTIEQFDEMMLNQGGMCAICDKEAFLVVDHDHATGKVRQLLCRSCNAVLGRFKDSADKATEVAARATKAAEYLTKHKIP